MSRTTLFRPVFSMGVEPLAFKLGAVGSATTLFPATLSIGGTTQTFTPSMLR